MSAIRRSSRADSGYTLMEMAVVLAIIGVIVLVGVARVDYLLPKYRVRAAVRDLGSEIRLARAQAMSTGMPHYIQYDVPNGKYWILSPEKKKTEIQEEVEETAEMAFSDAEYIWTKTMEQTIPEGVEITKIFFSAGVEASTMPVTIECSPQGTVRAHTIFVTGKEDQQKFTIAPSTLTGSVEFKEGHIEPAALEEAVQ